MVTVKFLGFPHTDTYRAPGLALRAGESGKVTKDKAAQLVADFPEAFDIVKRHRAPKTKG